MARVAAKLGVSARTLRRCVCRGVIPPHLATISACGYVRLRADSLGLVAIKNELNSWSVFRRKPAAARHTDRQSATGRIQVCLREYEIGFKPEESRRDYRRFVRKLGRRMEGPNLPSAEFSPEHIAEIELAIAVRKVRTQILERAKLNRKKSHRPTGKLLQPTVKEIAEVLHVSPASLYRAPFGRAALNRARKMGNEAGSIMTRTKYYQHLGIEAK